MAIPPEGKVIIMDLPVDRVFGARIRKSGITEGELPAELRNRLVWIDHHATSIATHPADITGYRIDGVAACRLAWQWFEHCDGFNRSGNEGVLPSQDEMPDIFDYRDNRVVEPLAGRLAGEYDVWDKREPDAERFQLGLRASRLIDFERLLSGDGAKAHIAVLDVVALGQTVEQYVRNQSEITMQRTAHHRRWCGLTFIFANLAIGNSDVFKSAITPETDALLMWRHDGRKAVISLYGVPGKPDVDLSKIAKSFGGGGHKQACGFEMSLSDFITTVLYHCPTR